MVSFHMLEQDVLINYCRECKILSMKTQRQFLINVG